MDVRLPDGTIIKNVPQGTTKEQLQKRLEAAKPGFFSSMAAGIKQGLRDIPAGIRQGGLEVPPDPLMAQELEQMGLQGVFEQDQARAQAFEASPEGQSLTGQLSRGITAAGPAIAFPALGARTLPGLMAGEAGLGAAQGAISFLPEGERRGPSIGIGEDGLEFSPGAIGLSTISGGAGAGAVGVFTRTMPRIAGGLPDTAEEMIRLGRTYGLPVGPADLSPALRRTQGALESVPFSGVQKRAMARNIQAGEVFSKQIQGEINKLKALKFDNIDEVRKVAQGGTRRSLEAQKVLRAIEESGDDLDMIILASGKTRIFSTKLAKDKLYVEAGEAAARAGLPPAPLSGTRNVAAREYQHLTMGANSHKQDFAIRQLEQLIKNIDERKFFSLEEMRATRSGIGGAADQLSKAKKATDDGLVALRAAQDAVAGDMDRMAKGSPEVMEKLRKANSFFRNTYRPLKDSELADAINKTELGEGLEFAKKPVDEAVNSLLRPGRAGRNNRLLSQLDTVGKNAVGVKIMADALEKASLREGGVFFFSPGAFGTSIQRYGPGTLDKLVGADRVKGIAKLATTISREAAPGRSPATGIRGADLGAPGAALVGLYQFPLTTSSILGGAFGLGKLIESPAISGLLVKAGRAGSRQETLKIIANIEKVLARSAAQSQAQQ